MNFLERYLQALRSTYPSASGFSDLAERFANLVTPTTIDLPLALYGRVQNVIKEIYAFGHTSRFLEHVKTAATNDEQRILAGPVKNSSVLMAYDFHYTSHDDRLSLIEVNTNASAYLIADLLYKVEPLPVPWKNPLGDLRTSFESELKAGGFSGTPRVAVMDENIDQQKMRVEFSMYADLFKSWGWSAEVTEASEVQPESFDLIYNRHTDFVFTHAAHLLAAYLKGKPIFSPNPREYLLLAAKERLYDFSRAGIAKDVMPAVTVLNSQTNHEKLWSERKHLFFKPTRAFGAKGAYRGSSISRKTFAEILTRDYLAQEFRDPGTHGDWKFDLRFYTYKDEVHLVVARVYQGQVTNMSQLGGGLARVRFNA